MDKRVLISVQRCLLEKITPNLRSVYAFEDEGVKKLIFCYDKSPSEEEQELASVAVTEFISDFPDIVAVSFRGACHYNHWLSSRSCC